MRHLVLVLLLGASCDSPSSGSSLDTCEGALDHVCAVTVRCYPDGLWHTVADCRAGMDAEAGSCADLDDGTVDWQACADAADTFKCPRAYADHAAYDHDVGQLCR